jgi:hypothetical protein
MAVIRLQLDIDSNVYPELYARLRSIDHTVGREERLRQLAALGLIWETVRMHGPESTVSAASGAKTPKPAPAPAPTPAPAASRSRKSEGSRSRSSESTGRSRSRPPVPGNVPMLMDVVDTPPPPPREEPVANAPVVELHPEGRPRPASPEDGPPLPPPLHTSVQPAGARSDRLRRMRDRGLFKNG